MQHLINRVVHDYGDKFVVSKRFNHPSQESKYIVGAGDDWLVLQGANTGLFYFVDFSGLIESQRKNLLRRWYVGS